MPSIGDVIGSKLPPRPQGMQVAAPLPDGDDDSALRHAMRNSGHDGDANLRRWGVRDTKCFGAGETVDRLAPGIYATGMSNTLGPYLDRKTVRTDSLLKFPDSAGDSILTEIREFWTLKAEFSARGFLHKRGVLMWGPPGSGKTSTLNQLTDLVVRSHGGIAVQIDHPVVAALCLDMVRKIEPNRPIIGVLEDIDALAGLHGEAHYLALLDGEAQVDNIVFVGTTNYPERLDPRFIDRPSRFDTVLFVGMPSAAARRLYFSHKEPDLDAAELDRWVELSHGFSVAHLREMIISVKCFRRPVEDVVARLEDMRVRRPTSEDVPRDVPLGFVG